MRFLLHSDGSNKGIGLLETVVALGVGLTTIVLISTLLGQISVKNRQLQDRLNLEELRGDLSKNLAQGMLCTCLFNNRSISSKSTKLKLTSSSLNLYPNQSCLAADAKKVASVNSLGPIPTGQINFSTVTIENIKAATSSFTNTRYSGDLILKPDFKNGATFKPIIFRGINIQTGGTLPNGKPAGPGRISSCGWQDSSQADPGDFADLISGRFCGDHDLCIGNYKIRISTESALSKVAVVSAFPIGAPGNYRVLVRTLEGRVALFTVDVSSGSFYIHQHDDYVLRVCLTPDAVVNPSYFCELRYAPAPGQVPNCWEDLYFRVENLETGEVKQYTTASCSKMMIGNSCGAPRAAGFGPCPYRK